MSVSVEKGELMFTIGKKIQELRKQQHRTQEDLANAVGVSTQAVSKWECGGTPDTMLLPKIADYFHVSIDYLFGRTMAEETDLNTFAYQEIRKLPVEQRGMAAYQVIYTLMNACSDIEDISVVMQSESMRMFHKKDMEFVYIMANEHVIAQMSLMDHFPYVIFMPEPNDGFESMLFPIETYEEFFQYFAKKGRLRMLYEMNRHASAFTSTLMSKRCHLPIQEVEEILQEFLEKEMIIEIKVETLEKKLNVYQLKDNVAYLGMFVMLSEAIKNTNAGFNAFTRKKPMINKSK